MAKKPPNTLVDYLQVGLSELRNGHILSLAYKLLFDPSMTWVMGALLVPIELLVNMFVIHRVKCKHVNMALVI